MASAIQPPPLSRQAFMGVFESIYDQHDAAMRLQAQLKDQLRKTSTLLQTLQSSGQMIEGLVRGHFREMQSQYGEKFGAALTDLNSRLVVLEQKAGITPSGEVFSASGGLKSALVKPSGKLDEQLEASTIKSVLNRIEALESKTKET